MSTIIPCNLPQQDRHLDSMLKEDSIGNFLYFFRLFCYLITIWFLCHSNLCNIDKIWCVRKLKVNFYNASLHLILVFYSTSLQSLIKWLSIVIQSPETSYEIVYSAKRSEIGNSIRAKHLLYAPRSEHVTHFTFFIHLVKFFLITLEK